MGRRLRKSLIHTILKFHLRSHPTWSRLPRMIHGMQKYEVAGGTTSGVNAVHLLLTNTEVRTLADDPEQVIQEIEVRATKVSSVLRNILTEPHDRPDWGLND